jgi:hypothetical protein
MPVVFRRKESSGWGEPENAAEYRFAAAKVSRDFEIGRALRRMRRPIFTFLCDLVPVSASLCRVPLTRKPMLLGIELVRGITKEATPALLFRLRLSDAWRDGLCRVRWRRGHRRRWPRHGHADRLVRIAEQRLSLSIDGHRPVCPSHRGLRDQPQYVHHPDRQASFSR